MQWIRSLKSKYIQLIETIYEDPLIRKSKQCKELEKLKRNIKDKELYINKLQKQLQELFESKAVELLRQNKELRLESEKSIKEKDTNITNIKEQLVETKAEENNNTYVQDLEQLKQTVRDKEFIERLQKQLQELFESEVAKLLRQNEELKLKLQKKQQFLNDVLFDLNKLKTELAQQKEEKYKSVVDKIPSYVSRRDIIVVALLTTAAPVLAVSFHLVIQ